jgi:predicted RNA binding protein YcfA (HicA-like mRNA interferase family)
MIVPTGQIEVDTGIAKDILTMPGEKRFAEVRKMLERVGYELDRVSGSHHIFTKPGADLVSIPVHRGKVKPFYVRQVEKIVADTEGPKD